MARRATKDTFGYENVGVLPGDETEVRRIIKAGQSIPDHYRVEDEGAVEEVDGPPKVGLGAAPPNYKHQLDDAGQVKSEHSEADERVQAERVQQAEPAENRRDRELAEKHQSRAPRGRAKASGDE